MHLSNVDVELDLRAVREYFVDLFVVCLVDIGGTGAEQVPQEVVRCVRGPSAVYWRL